MRNIELGLHTFNVKYILESNRFTPGDYKPINECNACLQLFGYHICESSAKMRMYNALARTKDKQYYDKLREVVRVDGLIAPLSAKIGHDDTYAVLIDGHTRLAIAHELDIPAVKVYVARYETHRSDLVAGDSGYWTKGVDSPWLRG